jgi:hypothetical protein
MGFKCKIKLKLIMTIKLKAYLQSHKLSLYLSNASVRSNFPEYCEAQKSGHRHVHLQH